MHPCGALGVPVRPGHRRGRVPAREAGVRARPHERSAHERLSGLGGPREHPPPPLGRRRGRLLVLAERAGDARRRAGDAVAERDELVAEDQLVQGGRRGRRARAGGPHRRGLGPRGGRGRCRRERRDVPQPVHRAGPEGSPAPGDGEQRFAARRARGGPRGAVRRSQRVRARLGWRRVRARGRRDGALEAVHSAEEPPAAHGRVRDGRGKRRPEEMRGRLEASLRGGAPAPERVACAVASAAARVKYDFDFAKGVWAVRDTGAVVIARDARDAAAGAAADASRPASETASETDERAPSAPKKKKTREASPETRALAEATRGARMDRFAAGYDAALAAAAARGGARTRRASPRRRSSAPPRRCLCLNAPARKSAGSRAAASRAARLERRRTPTPAPARRTPRVGACSACARRGMWCSSTRRTRARRSCRRG